MIFSHFPGYGLLAYNLAGKKVWEYQHMPITYSQGGSSSPVIKDNLVIININQRGDTRIQALDCATGDTLWAIRDPIHKSTSIGCSASPVLWHDLLIIHQDAEIVAYNLVKKAAEWWLSLPTTGVSTPVIHDDVLYMAAWSNFGENKLRGSGLDFEGLIARFDQNSNLKIDKGEVPDSVMVFLRPESPDEPRTSYTFNRMYSGWDPNNDGAFEKKEWDDIMENIAPYLKEHGMLAIPVSGQGERPYSEIIWKINEDTPETPSPLVAGDNVLFIKNGGILTAIDRKTGEIFKKERIGATGAYISSPMLAGNRVYACSYNGTVTVLSADDFKVLANNKLNGKIGASPLAVDDVLYVRTDKYLYAFSEE
jgi:outer membrane protein assembly factor BamB